MSAATTDDMIAMLPELTTVSSGTIALYLDDAALRIQDVDESDAGYGALHRYMAAHLLAVNNIIRGEITSERVADVGVGYANAAQTPGGYADKWERAYYQLLSNYFGPDERIS
jgi:hypothetical protein